MHFDMKTKKKALFLKSQISSQKYHFSIFPYKKIKISIAFEVLVQYVGNPREFHARVISSHVYDYLYVMLTPDGDVYVESLIGGGRNIAGLRDCGPPPGRAVPFGTPAGRGVRLRKCPGCCPARTPHSGRRC